jgi:NAD(P)-dependent dehydrogenase (short-subunit alcohol dehydrogenase family)
METLKGRRAVVTGGSRGLGLGIVEALVAQGALVTAIALDAERLAAVAGRLGVEVISGDITDEDLAYSVIQRMQPSILILNAGATPVMEPIHEVSWANFNRAWDVDVKATFHWVQEAIKTPLPRGSRVIIGASGAAMGGSPLSGSYAGAKKMQMFMANYANGIAKELDLGIRFQAIAPLQIIGDTELGRAAAEAYAKRKGVSIDDYFAGFGVPLPPAKVGEHVVSILTDPQYAAGTIFGLKGDKGIISLDG